MTESKCPRCGSERTHWLDPWCAENERIEWPFRKQVCSNFSCRLQCRFWQEYADSTPPAEEKEHA